MHNLKCIHHSFCQTDSSPPITASAWDSSTNSVICAFGPTEVHTVIILKRLRSQNSREREDDKSPSPREEWQHIASWDAPCPLPDIPCDQVLALRYFPDEQTIGLVLAGGDFVLVREVPTLGQERIEIVGSIDAGITAATWSPDEELLAISTRLDTVLFMTRDYENIVDVAMTAEDVKASRHVDVGWGKVETQFKGKRAKGLRDPTVPERMDSGTLSPYDRGNVVISWRGDGAFVAVMTTLDMERRIIRVFSRDGALDSVSEPVNGLEGALSWKPTGNLISGIARLEDRIDVVFFERNGLRHGQFPLRLDPAEMNTWGRTIELSWNADSTVLAISFIDRVQLWTMGNYHYYLKQEIRMYSEGSTLGPVTSTWHPEKGLCLAIHSNALVRKLEYASLTAGGSVIPPHDFGTLAVIDGCQIKLTPLRLANVPPPLAYDEIQLQAAAVDVALSHSGTYVAALCVDRLELFKLRLKERSKARHELVAHVDFQRGPDEDIYSQQIAFLGDSDIFVSSSTSYGSAISRYGMEGTQLHRYDWLFSYGLGILRLFSRADYQTVCLETELNILMEGVDRVESYDFKKIGVLPGSCSWVEVASTQEEVPVAFGLSKGGVLYANERVLARSCTSCLLSPCHLIYTTSQHNLKFIHLTDVHSLEAPPDDPERDERCRSIERGAKLVAVVPTTCSLTLQMPRGNLETIFPRALVLSGIRKSIAVKDYRAAFFACRNQRVDMNILHDHAPKQFMSSIGLFIDQIQKAEHIDLFLSQLRDEDVSKVMYKETLPRAPLLDPSGEPSAPLGPDRMDTSQHQFSSKSNRICDAFLLEFSQRKASNPQNVITAHVCKSPPNLESGLRAVGELRERDSDMLEKAVEHICFLADVNQLFDAAIGLYDLDLALLVAQQSQKDPREYLPFLQNLQKLPTLDKKFSIDDHLGRYTKALIHMHDIGNFDKFKRYTVKQQLHKEAIEICKYRQEELSEISLLYAEALEKQSQHREAAILFESLSRYQNALDCYRAASCWKEALFCAHQLGMEEPQIVAIATTLSDGLYESRDYFNAARVQIEYRQDVEAATRTFCKGYFFAEAMRVIASHTRQDLLESVLEQGLIEGFTNTTELLADCKGQLNAQTPRLRELRVKKIEDQLAYFEGTASGDIPDNVSLAATDTSTSASLFTRYSNRTDGTLNTQTTRKTSKNRRREERKRARGKKGSVYEEEYLINSVGRLIRRVNDVWEEVERLVEGLLRRGMRERALAVEKTMTEVVDLCRACVDEVFETSDDQAPEKSAEPSTRPAGADGVLWDSVGESQRKRDKPVVLPFKGSLLLSGTV